MLTRLQIEMIHVHVAPKFSPRITMIADTIAHGDTLGYLVVKEQLKLFINGRRFGRYIENCYEMQNILQLL